MAAHKRTFCTACARTETAEACDHCGQPLCRDCRRLELWGSGAEDLSAKYLCAACTEDPEINPWGARVGDPDLKTVIGITGRGHERHAVHAALKVRTMEDKSNTC